MITRYEFNPQFGLMDISQNGKYVSVSDVREKIKDFLNTAPLGSPTIIKLREFYKELKEVQ